jgi:hypothetical protein
MAVRLLSHEYIVAEMFKRKCIYVKEYGTASMWKTSRGVHFTIPQEGPDKRTDEYTWERLLKEIEPYL